MATPVYFEFKPVPRLWIKAPTREPAWVVEELSFIQQYSPIIIVGWVLGVPLLVAVAAGLISPAVRHPRLSALSSNGLVSVLRRRHRTPPVSVIPTCVDLARFAPQLFRDSGDSK